MAATKRGFGVAILCMAPLALAAAPGRFEPTSERAIDPARSSELNRAESLLRQHVAVLSVTMKLAPRSPFVKGLQVEGYAIATGPRELRCQAHLVKGADTIQVQGPLGRAQAVLVDLDVERRVAWLDVEVEPLGLRPASPSPSKERTQYMDVLALVSTAEGSGVLVGQLLALGDAPHLEGNLRASLELRQGMPIFDTKLRWLGIARTVAWDRDRLMFVPPELTETTTVSRPRPADSP